MVEIRMERMIAAPSADVFDWLADPKNLTAAPAAISAGLAKDSPHPAVGAQRWLVGIGMWIREVFTAYDPPNSYSYRIIRAFPAFRHEGGTLTFTPSGEGTHVHWRSVYSHPVYAGGKITEAISAPLLRSSFKAILDSCAEALEH
jgi:uncharacterized protein YndB with AHSA1/START domain